MDMIASYHMVNIETISHLLALDGYDLAEEIQDTISNTSLHTVSIDKNWDGLHFLLTEKSVATPLKDNKLSEAVMGAHFFSEGEENDFITFLLFDEIKEIVTAMTAIKKEKLKKSFSPELFSKSKIYPDIWLTRKKEDLFDNLYKKGFKPLLQFYRKALRKRKCVIITILS